MFTNLDTEHFEGHASLDEYREAKGRLFAALTDGSRQRAVVSADDPAAQFFIDKVGPGVPVITYSTKTIGELDPSQPLPDVYPLVIDLSLFDSVLTISTPAGDLEVTSMLLGMANVANVCAAVAVGCALGISLDVIADGASPPGKSLANPASRRRPPASPAAGPRASRAPPPLLARAGIQSLDNGVPGRLEMVDENQPFAVIVGALRAWEPRAPRSRPSRSSSLSAAAERAARPRARGG